MKTYSGMWETGGYLFQKKPGSELMIQIPSGFSPMGEKSSLKSLKDIPHDVFKNNVGRKLIVMEDK